MKSRLSIGVVLFRDFELLDVFGPLEMFGLLPEHFELCMLSQTGAIVESRQGPKSIVDLKFATDRQFDILLVPGGMGTRQGVDNPTMLAWLRLQAAGARFVTSVCSGSALLARSGLLDGRRATTNKAAFEWVSTQSEKVDWQKRPVGSRTASSLPPPAYRPESICR